MHCNTTLQWPLPFWEHMALESYDSSNRYQGTSAYEWRICQQRDHILVSEVFWFGFVVIDLSCLLRLWLHLGKQSEWIKTITSHRVNWLLVKHAVVEDVYQLLLGGANLTVNIVRRAEEQVLAQTSVICLHWNQLYWSFYPEVNPHQTIADAVPDCVESNVFWSLFSK